MLAPTKPGSARPRFAMLFATVLAFGAGCGAKPRDASAIPNGATAILVENLVREPDMIDSLLIEVDGVTLPLSALPPEGGEPASLGALRLAPGAHSIAIRVTLRGEGASTIVVASERLFHLSRLEEGRASIRLTLRSREVPELVGERVAIDLWMRGGELSPEVGASPGERAARCAPLLPSARALCRVALMLDEAATRRDVVLVNCLRDKLVAMRRLSEMESAAEMREEGVLALLDEAEHCVGESTLTPDGLELEQ